MKEYRVFLLTREGIVLDDHQFTSADDEEIKERAKGLAVNLAVEVWIGPVRIARFNPAKTDKP